MKKILEWLKSLKYPFWLPWIGWTTEVMTPELAYMLGMTQALTRQNVKCETFGFAWLGFGFTVYASKVVPTDEPATSMLHDEM